MEQIEHRELAQVVGQLEEVLLGKSAQIRLAVCSLLARGHLLIEDLPGMGKTTFSHALAITLGMSYQRIQFTSDLLPADLTGIAIFNQDSHQFEFRPGPVFSQVVLADEINRASPKTQSAMLEAMAERQVSVDGTTHTLPNPYFVIATQNPAEQFGTFPLPESQLDRFMMRISIGYPSAEAELRLLEEGERDLLRLQPIISSEQLLTLQAQVDAIHCSRPLLQYVLALVRNSRQLADFPAALSPRASQALVHAARAWAFMHGREHVQPDDVQSVFEAVCEHRLAVQERGVSESLSRKLLESVDVSRVA